MPRAPSSPPQIDGYVVDRLIGSGGFSDVFLYEQQLPRRKVAVKALLTHELTAQARAGASATASTQRNKGSALELARWLPLAIP